MIDDRIFGLAGAWPLLLVGPVVFVVLRLGDRVRARQMSRAVGRRVGVVAADRLRGRRPLRDALLGIAMVGIALAVMQPHWGEDLRRVEQQGVDILVCLDVSRSMLARDVEPSRLARARAEIGALAERARGDRLGLVAFAGEARLAVPLTRDRASFRELVDTTDPLAVGRGGTDLGAALDVALEALGSASGAHEVVVLVTDGEDLEQRGLRAARVCAERGVRVHTVGVGSVRGSKIAVAVGDGGETFLRDRSGDDVVTAMDPEALRAIAGATGGVFVDVAAEPRPLVALYEQEILPMARKGFEAGPRDGLVNRFRVPLGAAFVLLLVRLAVRERRRRP